MSAKSSGKRPLAVRSSATTEGHHGRQVASVSTNWNVEVNAERLGLHVDITDDEIASIQHTKIDVSDGLHTTSEFLEIALPLKTH